MLIQPIGSALQVSDVMLEKRGDAIEIYVEIKDYSSPQNLSVEFYYAFEQDITEEGTRSSVKMTYNPENGLWEAAIQKKYDASTLHYWINVTDMGADDLLDRYADYGPSEYSYTTPLDLQYTPCIIGAVVVFAAFEVFMHYGRIRERFPRKEPEDKAEGKEEKNKEEEGSGE